MPEFSPDRSWPETGNGGLDRAVLRLGGTEAHVYAHGGQVTHYAESGQPPLLFLSRQSHFAHGKPIRGGVPICFPWFGPRNPDPLGDSPMHGFARVLPWTWLHTFETNYHISITLMLSDNELTRRWWPYAFAAHYTVSLSGGWLVLELKITNQDSTPFTFEEALHTYLAVADVRNTSVDGLDGARYLDKTQSFARKVQSGPVTIAGETDRVYLDTRSPCLIRDPGYGREIIVEKEGSDATVVWNPWVDKARAMPDFGDDEWSGMLCVETCNVGPHAVTLGPGKSHTMKAVIRARPLGA